ncbi:MAG TPA: alpha/beta hydrolase [Dongiaceae bacterium]|nr:alpha/beta hydrolase [Dongiaceae bacterium]
MPVIAANGVALRARIFGPSGAPALLMIQGLGMQLTDWPRPLLARLAERYRIVLYDNRDYGRSQPCGPAIDRSLCAADYPFEPVPPERAPYSLYDLAEDARALLNAFGIERAHVAGFSLGGMIAQVLAARHPHRVRSLTSLMSSMGQPVLPASAPAARLLGQMIVDVPDRTRLVAQSLAAQRVWAGGAHGIDAAKAARHFALSYRRCYRPAAIYRQALAYASAGERSGLLRAIRCPTLVIHGERDPLIPPAYALEARRLVPEARILLLPDGSHDLHPALLPRLATAMLDHLARSDAAMRLGHMA